MPRTLRSRIALFVLLGAFLIPVATSSLRGLTHVLTCSEAEIPFAAITLEGSDAPILTSARTLTRDFEQETCEGLEFDFQGRQAGPGRVAFTMAISNHSDFDWHGSVKLKIDGDIVPFDIGEIRKGASARDTVTLTVPTGLLEVSGGLLVGP